MEEVARATRYLTIDDAWHLRKVVVDTHIDNLQIETMLAAEHIDTASATGEVDHLLPSDLTGRHTDTLALDTMIAPQEQMTGMRQTG